MAKEKEPKAAAFGNPQCEKVVTLSLHSSFRKSKLLQILRECDLKKVALTQDARNKQRQGLFTICAALYDN